MSGFDDKSIENVGWPIVLAKVVKNWYRNYDVFYDHFSQTVIFHSKGKFYIQYFKKEGATQKMIKFNIGVNFNKVFACAVNHDCTMIAWQSNASTVYVFNNSQ